MNQALKVAFHGQREEERPAANLPSSGSSLEASNSSLLFLRSATLIQTGLCSSPTLTTHQRIHIQYKGPEYMLNRHPHKVLGPELVTKKKGSGGF